jgi:hypothetical protein
MLDKLCRAIGRTRDYLLGAEDGSSDVEGVRGRCHRHLDAFLDQVAGDPEKLGWTYIELKEKFPLSSGGPSSASDGPNIGGNVGVLVASGIRQIREAKRPTAKTSAQKAGKERRVPQRKGSERIHEGQGQGES